MPTVLSDYLFYQDPGEGLRHQVPIDWTVVHPVCESCRIPAHEAR